MKNLFLLCLLILSSCDDANLNEGLATDKEKNSYSYKLQAAQTAYDEKNFQKSLSIINKLIEKHGEKEDLVLFKSYSTFGLSGFDPIDISRRFYGAWQLRADAELTRLERFVRAIDLIGQLTSDEFYDVYTRKADLIGIADELRLPIEDVHNNITTTRISYIIQSARILCNQVDSFAQYFDWGCTPTTKNKIKFESHMLWARIHFAESILLLNTIVRAVLVGKQSLLDKLGEVEDKDPQSYLDIMSESSDYLDALFPDDNSKTMIHFIVNDWLTVINSFNLIGKTESKLESILLEIEAVFQQMMDDLPDSYSDQEKKVIILKNLFSRKILFKWQDYYTQNKDNMTEGEKNEFCEKYKAVDTLNIYPFSDCV